jgi:hypothetical protein
VFSKLLLRFLVKRPDGSLSKHLYFPHPRAGSSFQMAFLCLNCYVSSKLEYKQVEMHDKFSIYYTNGAVAPVTLRE